MEFITIKIDKNLHDKTKKIIGKSNLRYQYSSVASFANDAIFEMLESIKKSEIKFPKLPKPNKVRLGLAKMGFSLRK